MVQLRAFFSADLRDQKAGSVDQVCDQWRSDKEDDVIDFANARHISGPDILFNKIDCKNC